ncbi:MAG: hypothetical protein KGZ74_00715 [Chitinophagaceae bacterium]|nr:hypothetical protein [Chitinophagaceae bacterium]
MYTYIKTILFLIYVSLFLEIKESYAQHIFPTQIDSIIVSRVNNVNLTKFHRQKLNLFFEYLKVNYKQCLWVTKKPGVIDHLIFMYGDSSSFHIKLKDLKGLGYLKQDGFVFNPINYYNCKIEWICFKYGGNCKKGYCNDLVCE